ncbi:MAG: restriction endonuclease subunit S [Sulfuricurvum sp.]|nr:restriction endonuclease subunit S [Sulfuricurvum sp.]MDP3022765.1 restriction endonuclease subunit S [Sulfuricurvum sp.]
MSIIPAGYKQTEIGVIPEDWEVCNLSEAVEFLDGQRRPIKSNERMSGIFPYYGASGIIDYVNDYIFNDDLILLGEDGENILSRNLPLAFRVSGKIWVNNHAHVLKPKEAFNIVFLTDYLESLDYSLLNSGTAQPKLNKHSCLKIKISKPTKPEQQLIATALSDTDALIESLEKLIAKKRQIKQGAMQELLTPKEGWEVKKLGEVGDIVTGSTPPTQNKEYWNGSIPWITPTDISNFEKNIYSSDREISHAGLRVIRKLPANTLLVTCIASIGKNAILRSNGACNQQINAIIPYAHYDVDFLYYLMENNNKYLLGKAGITATLMISKKDFSEINFSFPTKTEQTAIAIILSDMDAEINALESRLEKTRTIKSGMMHELLTGRIRLI